MKSAYCVDNRITILNENGSIARTIRLKDDVTPVSQVMCNPDDFSVVLRNLCNDGTSIFTYDYHGCLKTVRSA